jgi:ABC-type polysaccharide/polyol phosphate export permease
LGLLIALCMLLILLLFAGWVTVARGSYKLATALIIGSMVLFAWSVHYQAQLTNTLVKTDGQKWHQTYMIVLLAGIPVTWAVVGVLGYLVHKRQYCAQYRDYEK